MMDTDILDMRTKPFLILSLLPLTFVISHVNGHSSSCAPVINIPRNSQFSKSEGESLTIICPVRSCSQELPNVTWCKIDKNYLCASVIPGDGISSGWEEQKGNYAVYFLKFGSVQINDSGFYGCSATYGEVQLMSGLIEITISAAIMTEAGPGNMTESKPFIPGTSKAWITYFFISVRVIIVIVVYTMIYCYLRQIKESNKASKSTFKSSKVKFSACSRNVGIISAKHQIEDSYNQKPARDLPTESFIMICDDLDTGDYELSDDSPQEQASV